MSDSLSTLVGRSFPVGIITNDQYSYGLYYPGDSKQRNPGIIRPPRITFEVYENKLKVAVLNTMIGDLDDDQHDTDDY